MMKIMEKIRQFMSGRYGVDKFGNALLIFAAIVFLLSAILNMVFRFSWLAILSYAAIGVMIFRMFSKNLYQREKENTFFEFHFAKIKKKVNTYIVMFKDKKHKYYKCPTCKVTMRVPKGKGKIEIRCKKCGQTFVRKT